MMQKVELIFTDELGSKQQCSMEAPLFKTWDILEWVENHALTGIGFVYEKRKEEDE
jgi:hypothetical protein